jgi:hypothetical protein
MPRAGAPHRRNLLLISLATNLGILGFFKYCNLFVDSAAVLLQQLGLGANFPVLNLSLTTGRPFGARTLYRRNRAVVGHAELMILDFEYNYFGNVPDLSPRQFG